MFRYRSRRFRQLGKTPGIPIAYVGMALLVLVCCALTFLGFVSPVYSTDANETKNRVLPFYGLLMATGGIVLSLVTERLARKLEVHKLVRGVFELLMLPGVVLGVTEIMGAIVDLFRFKSSKHASDQGVLCGILLGMEALATMVWLTRLDRREQRGAVQAQ